MMIICVVSGWKTSIRRYPGRRHGQMYQLPQLVLYNVKDLKTSRDRIKTFLHMSNKIATAGIADIFSCFSVFHLSGVHGPDE